MHRSKNNALAAHRMGVGDIKMQQMAAMLKTTVATVHNEGDKRR